MNVGVFGGTFDPPHFGHLIVAADVQEQLELQIVLFVPAAHAPHKGEAACASPSHRLKMLELAVAGNPRFKVSDIEILRGGKSYTIDTLSALRDSYRDEEFFLIIGSEHLQILPSWKNPEEVVKMCTVVVVDRPGIDRSTINNKFVNRVKFVDVPTIEISGTEIRRRIREGKTIRYLVPESVRSYIHTNKLYES